MQSFEVEVRCAAGGTAHTHTMTVKCVPGVYNVSPPGRTRLQYTCPATGEARIATFRPPPEAGKPFSVAKVN